MKQIDFDNGNMFRVISATVLPMLTAQILNLLYNIVDRIYIARIPEIGTLALGAVGLCFPLVILITAFTNLYGSGGAPLFSIARGRGDTEGAKKIQNISFSLLVCTAILLILVGEVFGRPILTIFGTDAASMVYALPYLRIYLAGTAFSMIATGMNPFINAQGFSTIGMTTVILGAAANIILDPVFIFLFGLGVQGAALATVISQFLSAFYVCRFLFGERVPLRLSVMKPTELRKCGDTVRQIVGLGFASFIMQFTNAAVQIVCNNVLSDIGGNIYVSVMTIINSARQMVETPLNAITEGSSPVISYNYGAKKYNRVKNAGMLMLILALLYSTAMWLVIRLFPEWIIGIFTDDRTIFKDAVPAFHLYFMTFIFMTFQFTGQTMFKSLGKKRHAIFFSLFRKAIIVIPLTYLLPYVFHMGVSGVFAAEAISNVAGGMACFITMLIVVSRMLKED